MRTPDLFPETKRKFPRLVRAHMVDAGDGMPGYPYGAEFECKRCGWKSGWLCFKRASDIRRGAPCKSCNRKKKMDESHG